MSKKLAGELVIFSVFPAAGNAHDFDSSGFPTGCGDAQERGDVEVNHCLTSLIVFPFASGSGFPLKFRCEPLAVFARDGNRTLSMPGT